MQKMMTEAPRLPIILLVLLYLCFVGYVLFSAPLLPERVAMHFDGAGRPTGWMSRSNHLLFMGFFGSLFPLVPVVLCFVTRYLPEDLINLPRRDYWLAEERRRATMGYLFNHSLWFACLSSLFVLGIYYLVVRANQQAEAHLPAPLILGFAGAFVAGVAAWCVVLILHFPPSPQGFRMRTDTGPAPPSIVRAVPDDAAALTAIAFTAKRHWGYSDEWMEAWKGLLTIDPEYLREHETFLARVDGRVAGFYSIVAEEESAQLEHLWVVPERMGQGLGRALFRHAVKRAQETGAAFLRIESDPNAVPFYERMGAVRTGVRVTFMDGKRRELPTLVYNLCQ